MTSHRHQAVDVPASSPRHAVQYLFAALVAALTVLMLSTAPVLAAPSWKEINASKTGVPGVLHSFGIPGSFDNAGTNPRWTSAVFSTMEYYVEADTRINASRTHVYLRVKTTDELNAMSPPPPSPFTVDIEVTMTNDEGETASGTKSFTTTYARVEPPTATAPSLSSNYSGTKIGAVGILQNWVVTAVFDNAGTNPRFTSVSVSPTEYFDADSTSLDSTGSTAYFQVKTAAQLNALDSPPDNPFTSTVDVTMTNDEGHTASGTISLQTSYARIEPVTGPTLSVTTQQAPPGTTTSALAGSFFDNAGTNPYFTEATFSTMEYYNADQTGISSDYFTGMLDVTAKTSAELNAMDPPPDNPFTVQVTLTMTNDEGETATGTVDYTTEYETGE